MPSHIDRTPNGRYLPGVTGNPGGRPKTPTDVRSALEAGSLAAAQRLVELINSQDERVSLAASMALLDRVLGKAPASVEVTSGPAEADWARIQEAWQSLAVAHLEAVHGSAGIHDLRDVPTEALEAVLIVADAARAGG
jgi:hypothetical protein